VILTGTGDLAKAQELQATWQPLVFGSADAREGSTAFIERRTRCGPAAELGCGELAGRRLRSGARRWGPP
jgi:hypothetical protein